MGAVRDVHLRADGVREAVGPHVVGSDDDRQSLGLVLPEVVVVDEVGQLFVDLGDLGPGGDAGLLEVGPSSSGEVLQLDPVSLGVGGQRRRRQVTL